MKEYEDFFRLAAGLRPIKIDFDYAETRRLLDHEWNGYDIPKGHDIIADDVDLSEANALTSRHQNSDLHRVVLDLDHGAIVKHLRKGGHELSLYSGNRTDWSLKAIHNILGGEVSTKKSFRQPAILGRKATALVIETHADLALIPSSTPDHHHLILDVNLPWSSFSNLLYLLESYQIIEYGYRKASIDKGYTTIRVPWVKKKALV